MSYIIFLAGLILSWRFNRSRVFFVITILGISQYVLTGFTPAGLDKQFYYNTVFSLISVLIPVNILFFSRLKERGIFSAWGLLSFGFIFLQFFYIALIVVTRDLDLIAPVSQMLLPFNHALFTDFLNLPQISVILIAFTGLLLIIKQFNNASHLYNALLCVLLASAAALHFRSIPAAIPVFFSASGIILIITILQDSYSMAYLDELTGIPGRRALREELLKLSGNYVIAMLDIDFFKKFNDTYGHDVGDDVLKLVASVMQNVGGGGKPFRYGGEEFTVVFPGKSANEAVSCLEDLREKIAQTGFTPQNKDKKKKCAAKQLFVTISIGLAEKNKKNKTPDQVIKSADNALYRAKKKGRNCVSK
ncbi:MAG TPA: GGDEF domain-containing protein [Methylomusa anaerophila]|nr:GGDEF domain-containing protein [Methylomusa anaerophila]